MFRPLLLLLFASLPAHAAEPKSLVECRAVAAREAKTETGARALLADCAKRFPEQPRPQEKELTETECLRQGKFYRELFIGPQCLDEDPFQRDCGPSELAYNARRRVSKGECAKRGDAWDTKAKLCYPKGEPALLFVCPNEKPAAAAGLKTAPK